MKNTKKKQKKRQYKSNLRRHNCIFTAQTEGHLLEICAYNGWSEKDIGRAIDVVTKAYRVRRSTAWREKYE
ncbi:MAG: hypothetical protein IKY90_00345 [Oscillospiraceae bacterium]|nr:hypothetical protein [Oscillospiraceae bacterium]